MPLQYRIDILQALKDKGYNTNRLRKEKLLSEGAIQRLRHSEPVSWSNIEQLCKLLECQPADIMEYYLDILDQMDFTEEEMHRIGHINAEELFAF